jgi:hypothetical protein
MRDMKKYALFVFFIFLTACELTVDIDVPFKEAQLTINSFLIQIVCGPHPEYQPGNIGYVTGPED